MTQLLPEIVSPQAIYDYVSKFVVGQHEAKMTVATSLFLHVSKYMYYKYSGVDMPIKKSNAILLGPSGSGKTYIVSKAIEGIRTLYGIDDLMPLLEIDATRVTGSGWAGMDLDSAVSEHMKNCKNPDSANTAVIFVDEIDKLCMPAISGQGTDHNRLTQYGLLKLVEGFKGPADDGRSMGKANVELDTTHVLFIFAGNFPHIRHAREEMGKTPMGFNSVPDENKLTSLQLELEGAGMVTQLAGRITMSAETSELNEEELIQVLTETEGNIIDQYKGLWSFITSGSKLKITKKDLNEMVNYCVSNNVGTRGLHTAADIFLQKKLSELQAKGGL